MADKAPAPAAEPTRAVDEVRTAKIVGHSGPDGRDGPQHPRLKVSGDAPRKGSSIRVRFGGTTYSAKVAGVADDGIIETEGLTPEAPTS